MVYGIVIIGGGIVGLATALKLKESNEDLRIALVEKEGEIAKHQTGIGEYYRSYNKAALIKALQKLVPEVQYDDIMHGELAFVHRHVTKKRID